MNAQSSIIYPQSQEWLEPDGRGGFASGTVSGIRTRRYHAHLLTAITPPTGRLVLVNGYEAWIETPAGRFALTSQNYAPGVIHPDGAQRIESFSAEPWPTWTFRCEDGTELAHEIFVSGHGGVTALTWRLLAEHKNVKLFIRPLISGRDYHSLHKENPAFRFDPALGGEEILWRPYDGVPGIHALHSSNGRYAHDPLWYRNFLYEEERARGLDDTEDLASPGVFEWDLSAGEAVWVLTVSASRAFALKRELSVVKFLNDLRDQERQRRAAFPSRLHRAADAYIVTGRHGKTIVAGYPWFTDWGRDTFIALRGLCLATGRLQDARDILVAWAGSVSEGMLPNRFPDHGEQPEYNSVDASLWFIVAVHELLQAANGSGGVVSAEDKRLLQNAVEAILEGYSRGTRFGIRADTDGLLAAGAPGVQLTWMDAKVGEWVVTPRTGKPVEIQALWLNALQIASQFSPGWQKHFARGLKSFRERFWNAERGCLFDVIDANHRAGVTDATLRPNQIFAVGGLPFPLLEGERAKQIVSLVEEKLLTPLGLRSLAPGEPGYAPRYEGGVWQRDGAYHQGTVWSWLIGPFVEAWVRVRGSTVAARREARDRFLKPLLAHLDEAGLGHVSEIADADSPHTPRGCPWQAWSVGEALRLDRAILAETPNPNSKQPRSKAGRTTALVSGGVDGLRTKFQPDAGSSVDFQRV
ncbi:MAG: glycogen debranching enzyme family protein [Verrucomicrobia bacterium]|nr:glycogen debranching enzyme family protein [Verrucomicrobiota bacterium]